LASVATLFGAFVFRATLVGEPFFGEAFVRPSLLGAPLGLSFFGPPLFGSAFLGLSLGFAPFLGSPLVDSTLLGRSYGRTRICFIASGQGRHTGKSQRAGTVK
jgi:hypothetical protein